MHNDSIFKIKTFQYKDLIGNFVSNLVLEVLSFVAEQERDNIRQREGIEIANSKGKHLGRPKAIYPDNFDVVRKLHNYILVSFCLKITNY
ncbi:MAG: hypothetical protein ACERKV_13180 [Clostridiaceae bacterium]